MALRFRELPWYFQTLLFFAVAVGIFVGGELIDLPPVLPLVSAKNEQADLERQYKQLVDDVAKLQAVKQRHQELRTRLGATRDQLVQIQTVVPREKQTDEFMRLLQGSAVNAQVSLRRFTARPVVFKESYAEIPFEIELDGPYYSTLEFFDRLGRSTRIVNAAGLRLQGIETGKSSKWEYTPGTTVAGVCTVTTYYIPPEAELAAAAPPAAGGGRGGRGGRGRGAAPAGGPGGPSR